ncbi:MAG: retroviral-like aspartic protease family protein [Planctomycetota bacterium]
MQCPHCLSHNHDSAGFCDQCGAPLHGSARSRAKGWGMALVVALFLMAVGIFALREWNRAQDFRSRSVSSDFPVQGETPSGASPENPSSEPGSLNNLQPKPSLELSKTTRRVPVGWVEVENRWGGKLSRTPAAVVGDGWLALPSKVVLGGERWTFHSNRESPVAVLAGMWRPGERVGLWVLEPGSELAGPELSPWDDSRELEFLPLESGLPASSISVGALSEEEPFLVFQLPARVKRPGVLVQGDRVVGWVFAPYLEGGWLWNSQPSDELRTEIGVDEFYYLTFAGGREERFAETLALPERERPVARLAGFAEGSLLEAKLEAEETPPQLRMEAILRRIESLAATLSAQSEFRSLVEILTEPVLVQLSHPGLLIEVILATAQVYGPEQAIAVADRLNPVIVPTGSARYREVLSLVRRLFSEWVRSLLEEGAFNSCAKVLAEARARFPQDAGLHLRAVELALAYNDWATAESRIGERGYPKSYADRVQVLSARIQKLKGQQGKIIIRYPPGAQSILVEATLNRRRNQQFIIDTGASLTTIPHAAADALGIRITPHTRRIILKTAGGDIVVPVVILSNLELGGWTVSQLEVVIHDLPNQAELGLLGLNFLNHFRMKQDPEEGVLELEPR